MSEIGKTVGARIKELRAAKGLSQEELAYCADLHTSHLGALERGEKSATLDSLQKIVAALDISFQELFDFNCMPMVEDDIYAKKLIIVIKSMTPDEQRDTYRTIKTLLRWKSK